MRKDDDSMLLTWRRKIPSLFPELSAEMGISIWRLAISLLLPELLTLTGISMLGIDTVWPSMVTVTGMV
jgi:hypothetical protein